MGHGGGCDRRARLARAASVSSRLRKAISRYPPKAHSAVLVLTLVTTGAVTLVPAAAQAAFPGQNGVIVFVGSGSCAGRHDEGPGGDQLFGLQSHARRPVPLTCTGGRVQHPFVSPDGSEVVFSTSSSGGLGQLFTLPLDTTRAHGTTRPTLVSGSPDASDDYPSWSPADDGTIVFERTGAGAISQLYTENVTNPSSAAPVFHSTTGFSDTEPVFDPSDANTIAFVRTVDGHTHIFSYDMSTQTLTDLSAKGAGGGEGNDSKPDYAPALSGGRIVFQSDRACGKMQLYTMAQDGTQQLPVFQTWSEATPTGIQMCTQASRDPVFSPQGDTLAYDRQGWGSISELAEVSLNASGAAHGAGTDDDDLFEFGAQPNWGPVATPPAQTPEVSLPVVLPVIGTAVAGLVLATRRRRARAAHR